MAENWKLTLACTRAEAENLTEDSELIAGLDPVPTIVTEEIEAFNDAKWQALAYFDQKPDAEMIAAIQSFFPSSLTRDPVLEKLPDADWLTLSQSNLKPVHAGRFYVHTSTNIGDVPIGSKSFLIEASQAFGTGGHETTSGCLQMLDHLKNMGRRFSHIADIGTGTGLLGFAASHLWPRAYVTASDIDPVSIDVTTANATINHISLGPGTGHMALCVASGTDHDMIQRRAPYDLLIANILAGPLAELAGGFAEIVAEGGTVILAGLLNTQARDLIRTYRRAGFRVDKRLDNGDWPCLCLIKRTSYGWKRPARAQKIPRQAPGDFGTW